MCAFFYDEIYYWQIWLHRIFDIMNLSWRFICQRWECLSHLSTLSFLKHLPCLLFLFRNLFGNNWKDFWKHLGKVQQSMIIITNVVLQHWVLNIIWSSPWKYFPWSILTSPEVWAWWKKPDLANLSKSKMRTYLFFFFFRFWFTKMVQTTFPVLRCCWWYKEYQPVVIASPLKIALPLLLQSEP